MASAIHPEKGEESQEIKISPTPSTGSLDDNYELYRSMRDVELDPAEAKKVLRIIDFRILSLLMVTYILQYLDKNCINIASVYSLRKDLKLVGQDYSWLGIQPKCGIISLLDS
jgi:hypothetical protein